jgi:hypothetical protein
MELRRRAMALKILIPLMAVMSLASPVAADMSGNEWRQYEEVIQRTYLAGIFDAWVEIVRLAEKLPILKDPVTNEEPQTELYHRARLKDMYGKLTKCVISRNMTYEQLAAIANKYLTDHPEDWSYSMASLFRSSLHNVCPK